MNNSSQLNNERPLVTFALFAYNQEQYIREAIEGAFSQTYEPLEIILSDDGSTDRTFEIMQEMVAAYNGPHSVVLRRNEFNIGTVDHVLNVAKKSKGVLIAVGAGDDISIPERIELQVDFWEKTTPLVVVTDYILIDNGKEILNANYSPYSSGGVAEKIFKSVDSVDIHGASAMYDRKIFEILKEFTGRYYFEDSLLNFICYWLGGKVAHLQQPLVKYRTHSNSLSNSFHQRHSLNQIRESQIKSKNYAKNKKELFDHLYAYLILNKSKSVPEEFDYKEFSNIVNRFRIQGNWMEINFILRVFIFILNYRNREIRNFLLPRLFGLNFFILLKFFLVKYKGS